MFAVCFIFSPLLVLDDDDDDELDTFFDVEDNSIQL